MTGKRNALTVVVGLVLLHTLEGLSAGQVAYQPDEFDSKKVMGVESCLKCHTDQVNVLKQHPHFAGFRTLHRDPNAKAMAKALGERSVKRSKSCVRCHYTPQGIGNSEKAISGISCESCHGPSRDWLLVHNDYGGPVAKPESETPAHKVQRIENSILKGMRHPSHLYALVRSCFRCHIVDDEELINKTAHPIRSVDFNMASWTQGKMRHNFFRTKGESNAPSDAPRRQIMYVVSLLAEFEFSLRATARSTAKAEYAFGHAQHCDQLRRKLVDLQAKLQHPQLAEVITVVEGVRLSLSNREQLLAAADRLSRIAWDFSQTVDGQELDAIAAEVPPPR